MTTNATELAKRLRGRPHPADQAIDEAATLIEQQAERIEALEAKCALLAASLDQAERERDDYRDLGQKTIGELSAQTFELESEIANLIADRDSWSDQASQRVADWDAMRVERDALKTRVEAATQELRSIANADTVEWDDPTQFEAWAKSRARFTLGKIATQGGKEGK